MLHAPLLIPARADFWPDLARALLDGGLLERLGIEGRTDFSSVRVVAPGFIHTYYLKRAFAGCLQQAFLPPRIVTLSAWLDMLPPDPSAPRAASSSERLMALYAELRQHGWLKKLFSARRNTDLLPLAQTLLCLFDELTRALLPALELSPGAAEERWQAALEQLPLPVRQLLSDEAQLVWTLWKTQLGASDPGATHFADLMRLADHAQEPLVWIAAAPPDPFHQAFLERYAERQPVLPVTLDWRGEALSPLIARAWPEIVEGAATAEGAVTTPEGVCLCATGSLEEEAQRGAQRVLDWLQEGKQDIAIIAQDRVVARRMRALLERARVHVADETGWKLSTTRAAAAVAALLETITSRAETIGLLDLLKSPFLFPDMADKGERVMAVEHALRRYNVLGGWEAVLAALSDVPAAREVVQAVHDEATHFVGRRTLAEWARLTDDVMRALGMRSGLESDAAGTQVIALFESVLQDGDAMTHPFSFAEWRGFLNLQMEATPFVPSDLDRRVVILQLAGMQLRSFDAVLMVGADADHLPSQINEMLFFANAVRRELGLPTREMRQGLQLRDFAEMLMSNPHVTLSWQAFRNGEPNAASNWIERLQLTLEKHGAKRIPLRRTELALRQLQQALPAKPQPMAPQLLPRKLSASGYNALVACPYQFFATRMLALAGLDELSDMPEKRDYGDWVHQILNTYHETLRDKRIDPTDREALLRQISDDVFGASLDKSAAALGYYARWQKIIPAYLAWADEHEAEGWRFVAGEQWFEKTLHWDGGQITLHGCIDRVDENADGERAVLDYKTRNAAALREKVKEREDHQLAFYGLLSDAPVTAAFYVALEPTRAKTDAVAAERYDEWQRLLETQIVRNVRAIAEGAALPASGIERICVYCEVRGMCRKGGWE
ncbi:PD-(D/E)XK nuclease family protein [Oxalobacteraceae bacterium OM1]|nr:PD-(D/E)XK nuclease family protein [Oxalobacteraceae bacterium OM1]